MLYIQNIDAVKLYKSSSSANICITHFWAIDQKHSGAGGFFGGKFSPTYLQNYFLLKALVSYDTMLCKYFHFFRHFKIFIHF